MYKIKYLLPTLLISLFATTQAEAQLTVVPSGTAATLTAALTGPGITIVSDTLICNTLANGTFTSVGTPIALNNGIILSTGRAANTAGTEPALTSTSFTGAGDADITSALLGSTSVSRDGCALIINFVPKGDTVSFNYQFGSEEYRNSTCGPYNDAFAFFIAGPGVSASYPGVNMALVPGTTIPVTVNSINSGTPGTGYSIATCNAMGSGSPFTAYYIDNTGGTTVSYRGYTTVLTAKHWVRPCDTYRIKMSVVDAANYLYDSGVFIEGGSLKSNTYHFDRIDSVGRTIAGLPNSITKGCPGDTLKIKSTYAVGFPTKLYLNYSGTAVNGTDIGTLADSVYMPAGDTVVNIVLTPLTTAPSGVKTLNIRLTAAASCGVVDTFSINIFDNPYASILTNDTTICAGNSITFAVSASPLLTYSWSPATYLDNAAIMSPTCTPLSNVVYTMTATLAGSTCPAMVDSVNITTVAPYVAILTPDTTICQGDYVNIVVNGNDTMVYSWTPTAQLDSANVKEPTAYPMGTVTYSVTATMPASGCTATDQITITVVNKDYTVSARDTFICSGATINLIADVDPPSSTDYTYQWSGPGGYSSVLQNPVITTGTEANEGTYSVEVTKNGVCKISSVAIVTVYPTPDMPIQSSPIVLCQYSAEMTLQIPGYNNVLWYSNSSDVTPSVLAPLTNTDSIGVFHYFFSLISFESNCIGTKQDLPVTIESCCRGILFVPDAFTPNMDGLNDVFKLTRTQDYAVSQMSVYNRWGQLVFHSGDGLRGWDGTFNGEPADMGTYYYVIHADCKYGNGNEIIKKGTVTLIR